MCEMIKLDRDFSQYETSNGILSTGSQSVSQLSLSHVRLCDPMNRSTPGIPVHHKLREFT